MTATSAVDGVELDAMSDEELDAHLEQMSVYARVSHRSIRSASSMLGSVRANSSR